MSVLPRYAHRNAKFYMSQGAWDAAFARLMSGTSGNTHQDLSAAVSYRFIGYPVVIDQTLPTQRHDQQHRDVASVICRCPLAWVVVVTSQSWCRLIAIWNLIRLP